MTTSSGTDGASSRAERQAAELVAELGSRDPRGARTDGKIHAERSPLQLPLQLFDLGLKELDLGLELNSLLALGADGLLQQSHVLERLGPLIR